MIETFRFRATMVQMGAGAACLCGVIAILGMAYGSAHAAASRDIRLSDDIAPPPFGFEASNRNYVIADETPLYISPYIYPGTVSNDKLKAGQSVDVIAKVKNYDWVLVGRNGVGVGYLPISRLSRTKKIAP